MKALIIDFSSNLQVKILNARIKSSVSIVSGYYLTLTPEDDPVTAAAAKIKDEGLEGLPAFIVPSGEDVRQQIFQLPKMPDKEIRKVLPREIAGIAENAEPMVINFLKSGSVDDPRSEKSEVAAVYCPEQKIFALLNHLKDVGINPLSIVPEVQGLKTLAMLNPGMSAERSGLVFLEMRHTRIDMNIFKNKHWGLERDFLFRIERNDNTQEDDLKDEDFTRISTELNRTFQFFKQRHRTYTINNLLIYGSGNYLANLRNLINDNHPVAAHLVEVSHFGNKVSFPSHLRDSQEFVSIFMLSIATALAVAGKNYLDLFPQVYKEKAKLTSRLVGMGVAVGVVLTILGGSVFYFEGIMGSYRQDLKRIRQTYQTLKNNAQAINDTKRERTHFFKRRYFLDFPVQFSYTAANFVRKLSLISDKEIQLLEIVINPGTQSIKFKLDGRIKSADNISAQSRFLQFYRKLKEFDDILDISSSKVAVNPREGRPVTNMMKLPPSDGGNEQNEVVLYFTVNGEIEPL